MDLKTSGTEEQELEVKSSDSEEDDSEEPNNLRIAQTKSQQSLHPDGGNTSSISSPQEQMMQLLQEIKSVDALVGKKEVEERRRS